MGSSFAVRNAVAEATATMVEECVWYGASFRAAAVRVVGMMVDKSGSDLSGVSSTDAMSIDAIARSVAGASFLNHDMLPQMRLTLALQEYGMLDFIMENAGNDAEDKEMPFELRHAIGMAGSRMIDKETLVKVLIKGTATSSKLADDKKLMVLTYLAGEL